MNTLLKMTPIAPITIITIISVRPPLDSSSGRVGERRSAAASGEPGASPNKPLGCVGVSIPEKPMNRVSKRSMALSAPNAGSG